MILQGSAVGNIDAHLFSEVLQGELVFLSEFGEVSLVVEHIKQFLCLHLGAFLKLLCFLFLRHEEFGFDLVLKSSSLLGICTLLKHEDEEMGIQERSDLFDEFS